MFHRAVRSPGVVFALVAAPSSFLFGHFRRDGHGFRIAILTPFDGPDDGATVGVDIDELVVSKGRFRCVVGRHG